MMLKCKLLRLFILPLVSLNLIVGNLSPVFAETPASLESLWMKKIKELSPFLSLEKVSRNGDASRFILHIRDIHADPQAQLNVGKAIAELARLYPDDLAILVEGASGSLLRPFQGEIHFREREKVARRGLWRGWVTGPEYAVLKDDALSSISVTGLEDEKAYLEDFFLYREAFRNQGKAEESLAKLRQAIQVLSRRHFSKELLSLTDEESEWLKQKIDGADFFKKYRELYPAFFLHPVFKKYSRILSLEKEIHPETLNTEIQAAVSRLAQSENAARVKILLNKVLKHRLGKIDSEALIVFLGAELSRNSVHDAEFQNLLLCAKIFRLKRSLNGLQLLEELNQSVDAIKQSLAITAEEKRILNLNKKAALLSELAKLELNRNGWQNWKKTDVGIFSGLVDRDEINSILEGVHPAEEFYEKAGRRDAFFWKNFKHQLEVQDRPFWIIVTGGFHSDALEEKLKDSGLNYAVASPRMPHPADNQIYQRLMTHEVIQKPLSLKMNAEISNIVYPLLLGNLSPGVSRWLYQTRLNVLRAELLDALEGLEAVKGKDKKPALKPKADADDIKRLIDLFIQPKYGLNVARCLVDHLRSFDVDQSLVLYAEKKADQLLAEVTASQSTLAGIFKRLRNNTLRLLAAAALILAIPVFAYQTYIDSRVPEPSMSEIEASSRLPQTNEQFHELFPEFRFEGMDTLREEERRELVNRLERVLQGPLNRLPSFLLNQAVIVRSGEFFQARFLDGNSISLEGLDQPSAVSAWLTQIASLLRQTYAQRADEMRAGNAEDIENFFGANAADVPGAPLDSNLRRLLDVYGENFPDAYGRDLIRWFTTQEIEDGPRASERLELMADVLVYWHLMSNQILESAFNFEFPRLNVERVGLISFGQRNQLRSVLRNFVASAGERFPSSMLRLFQIYAVPRTGRDDTAYAGLNVNFEAQVFLPGDSENEGRPLSILEEEGFSSILFSRFARHLFELRQQPDPSMQAYPNAAYYAYALSLGRSSRSDELNIDRVFEIYGTLDRGMELFGQDLNQWLQTKEVMPGTMRVERAGIVQDIFRYWEAMESEEGTFGPGTSLETLEQIARYHYNEQTQLSAVRQIVHYPFRPDSWRQDARERVLALMHVAFSDAPDRVRSLAIGILTDLLTASRGLAVSENVQWDYASYRSNASLRAMSLELTANPELLQALLNESHARAGEEESCAMLELYTRNRIRSLMEREDDFRSMIRWDLLFSIFLNMGWSFLNYRDQKHLAYLTKLFVEGLREGYIRGRALSEIGKLIGIEKLSGLWERIKAAMPEFKKFDDDVIWEIQMIKAEQGKFPVSGKGAAPAVHFEGALLYSELPETGPFIGKRNVTQLTDIQGLITQRLRRKERYAEHDKTLKRVNAELSASIKDWVAQEGNYQEIRIPLRDGHFLVLHVENEILDHFPESQLKVLLQWALSMDRSLHGTDYTTLDKPIVVALLDQSPYMMMDHVGNGFIGINRALFQVPEGPLREIFFQLGMVHELRHEATRGQVISEKDFAAQDQALRKELAEGRSYDDAQWCRELFSMGVLDGRSHILKVENVGFISQINDVIPGSPEKLVKFYDMKIFPKSGISLDELTEDAREILEEIPIAALTKLVEKLGLNFHAPGIRLDERVENGRKLFSRTLSELKILCGPDITLEFPRLMEEAFQKKVSGEHVLDAMVRLARKSSPWISLRAKMPRPILSFEGAPLNKIRYKDLFFIGKKGIAEVSREQKWALRANHEAASMIRRLNRDIAETLRLKIQEQGKHEIVLVEIARQQYLKLLVDKDIIERWGLTRVEKLVREALQFELQHNHTDLSQLKGPLVIGLLSDAPHLMADHIFNGFIGIHEALFDLPDGIVRDVMFQVGFMHELRHELQNSEDQWGDTESEFLLKDLILKRALLEHHQYSELRWNIQVMYSDVLDVHANILKLGPGYYDELDGGIAGNERRAREFFDKMIAPASGVSFDVLSREAQEILPQIPLPKLASLVNTLGLHFGFTGQQSYTYAAETFSRLLVDIFKLQGYRIYLNWNDMVTRSRAAYEKGLYPNLFDAMLDMARAGGEKTAPHYQVGDVPVPHEEVVNPFIRQKMENVVTHLQESNGIKKREEAQRVLDLTPLHYDPKEGVVILQFSKMVDVMHHLLQEAKKYAVVRTPGFLGKNPAAVQPIHDILLGLHGVFASYPELAEQYRNMRLIINLKDFAWGSYAGSHTLFHYGAAGRDLPTVYASGPVLLRLTKDLLNENMEAEKALKGVLTHEWMHSQGKGEAESAAAQKEMDKTDYLRRLAMQMIEENQSKADKGLEKSVEYLALRRMVLDGNLVWAENFLRGLIALGARSEDVHKMLSKLLSLGGIFQASAIELCGALRDVVELNTIEKSLIEESFASYRRSVLSLKKEIAGFFRVNDSLTVDFKSKTVILKKPYSGFKTFQIPDSLLEEIETDQRQSIIVDSLEHFQSAFESRWMTTAGRKSDVFLQTYFRDGGVRGLVDKVEKQVLVLDLDLIKKEKEGDLLLELREIIRKLPKNVEVIVLGSDDERNIAEILMAEGGLKASDLKRLQIYSYGSREKDVDEWIVSRLLKEGKAKDLSEIKFIGTKENLDHDLYGAYLRSQAEQGLTSVFGDGKNSLAQLVVMVFEARDAADLKRALHQAGFSEEEIEEMMPVDGKIPPLPVAGAFTDSLKENYQTQRMIEAAA